MWGVGRGERKERGAAIQTCALYSRDKNNFLHTLFMHYLLLTKKCENFLNLYLYPKFIPAKLEDIS